MGQCLGLKVKGEGHSMTKGPAGGGIESLTLCIELLFLVLALLQVQLLQVRLVPKSKCLRIIVSELLQAGCISYCPTNGLNVQKDVEI